MDRLRDVARRQDRSLNELITRLARAITDPETAGDDVQRLRERLARAGLLEAPVGEPRIRPDVTDVAAARRRAAQGKPLSAIVGELRG